jgi:AcrR family transcriptional regulator
MAGKQTLQGDRADGRRKRSEASRGRIVRAMLELVGEGIVSPGAEVVAERAGVGLRTVFRHFDNMEGLYQEINAVMTAEVRPMWERPFENREWPGLIDELVERRSRLFERIMPYKIAADMHRHQSPFLAGQVAELTREQRVALTRLLPKTWRDNSLFLESLDLVLSFETWRRLRKDQKLSPQRARQVLGHLAAALLKVK